MECYKLHSETKLAKGYSAHTKLSTKMMVKGTHSQTQTPALFLKELVDSGTQPATRWISTHLKNETDLGKEAAQTKRKEL